MKHIGFWDEYAAGWTWQGRERTLLNNVIDQAEVEVGNLQTQVQMMARELHLLRTVVTVLVGTLRDTNAIDPALLDARLQAAIDGVTTPGDLPTRSAAAANGVICIQCKRDVAPRDTTMTETGPMCDRCSAAWLPNP